MAKTIPVYWGAPSIGKFFDSTGIIQFDSLENLDTILKRIESEPELIYRELFTGVESNYHRTFAYAYLDDMYLYQIMARLEELDLLEKFKLSFFNKQENLPEITSKYKFRRAV